jgi:hypothetical protein
MATTPRAGEQDIASDTLAYLRSPDRKLDVVIETSQRHGERLARLERDLGELKRDVVEVKGDIASLENKVLTAQTGILAILHRLDMGLDRTKRED